MQEKIKILDCTLRDGGHVNNWGFGEKKIYSIVEALVEAKVDIIELGLIKDIKPNKNLTLKPNLKLFENIAKKFFNKSETFFTVMIRPDWIHDKDFYNNENLDYIKGIRFAFYPNSLNLAIEQANKAKENGFKIFFNPVAISTYSNAKILSTLKKLSKYDPIGFSIVDTFGALDLTRLKEIYEIFDCEIPLNSFLGLHLHENQSNARYLANQFMSFKNKNRMSIIDSSLLGMGRIPGNLCTEQIINDIDKKNEKYNLSPIYNVIENDIAPLKEKFGWGYSPEYMISSNHNINRNYAEFFARRKIPLNLFDKACEYISLNQNDSPLFSEELAEKCIKKVLNKES